MVAKTDINRFQRQIMEVERMLTDETTYNIIIGKKSP